MKRLAIHLENCNGCKRCEQACTASHSQSCNISLAFVEVPRPKTRIFIESVNGKAVPIVCRHCKEPACVDACITGSMQKDEITGIVTNINHEQKCIGCWMCVMACPYGVINTTDTDYQENQRFGHSLKCDLCPSLITPACVSACPMDVLEVIEV